jgi:MoxR-like ATPase
LWQCLEAAEVLLAIEGADYEELSEQHMPERLIVVATSNDVSTLDEALMQRFDVFPFHG